MGNAANPEINTPDAARNLFLRKELETPPSLGEQDAIERETPKIMARLNPISQEFGDPVSALTGGHRQSLAIVRAMHFDAQIPIMDDPTAALVPHEAQMVAELIKQLESEGVGIYVVSHDIHDVMNFCDRASVMKNGKLVGAVDVNEVTDDDLLGMIILGKQPGSLRNDPRFEV